MADYGSSAPSAAASGGAAFDPDAGLLDAEDERLLRNIGDHPLMDRVQAALQKQLQKRLDRVDEELRDKQEEAARSAGKREELGVELYGVQQQLAKLQMQLETTQQNAAVVAEARTQAETDLVKFKEVCPSRRFAGVYVLHSDCLCRATISGRSKSNWRIQISTSSKRS